MEASSQTRRYENDALRWVAAEVRYPPIEELGTRQFAAGVRDQLRELFPVHEPFDELSVGLGLAGPTGPTGPTAQQTVRHRLVTRDRLMSATFGREALILETTSYQNWQHFRGLLATVLAAVGEAQPGGIVRLGLRYVDEIRIPQPVERFADWAGWVDDRLVAPVTLDDTSAPSAATIILQYGEGAGYMTILRAGPVAQGRAVQPEGPLRMPFDTPADAYFLLDTDAAWTEPDRTVPEFDVEAATGIFDELHETCSRLFEESITDRLRDEVLRRPREEVWATSGT
jgi:uncharacterized protein (TIGR04255 family)